MKKKYIDYDFADEIKEKEINKKEEKFNGFIKRTTIITDTGFLKDRKGTYISFEYDNNFDEEELIDEIASTLKKLVKSKKVKKNSLILCFGIGNEYYSSDSLGPKTIKKIDPTSHLFNDNSSKGLCSLIPGVKGITGLDSARIAKGLIKEYPIKCVIAIDALVTHDENRLFKVIQITDAGITPGGGLHSYLKSLNEKYLKVPVIAIGVATCLPSKAIVESFLAKVEEKHNITLPKYFDNIFDDEERRYYTPKDTEEVIEWLSYLLSKSIEKAFKY